MVGPALDCSGNAFWLGYDAHHVSTGDAEEPVWLFRISRAFSQIVTVMPKLAAGVA